MGGYPKRGVRQLVFAATGWVLAGVAVLGLVLAVPAMVLLEHGWALDTAGVTAEGQVTRLWIDDGYCGQSLAQGCEHDMVDYVFPVGGGTVTASASVSGSFFAGLREGGAVEVRYVPGHPGVSEIEAGLTMIGAMFLALLALGIGGAGAYGLWRRRKAAVGMVGLREGGVVRQAVVSEVKPSNIRVNNRPQWVMAWRDEAGVAGKSRIGREESFPKVGSAITVYADPAGKLPPVWEGDSGTR